MKIGQRQSGSESVITIVGDIDSQKCNCLECFWEQHVGDSGPMRIEMARIDQIDPEGIATVVSLLRQRPARPAVLVAPPQMLAHTLYKAGMLRSDSPLRIEQPRNDEPYPG